MDSANIRFDKTPKDILDDIQTQHNSFCISDKNNNNINNAFNITESSNKLLYNYVGIMCKKIWNHLNENKRFKIVEEEKYISFSPTLKNMTNDEFQNWDKVLLVTDDINGFINLNIKFDNDVTIEFINEFVSYLNELSRTIDILLFYYVYMTRNVSFTNIDDLKNLVNSSISEFEDDVLVQCTSNFSLDYKFNIINYYHQIFVLNSKTDIIIHNIWMTEEEHNNKQKEAENKPDNFDIFSKLFNNKEQGDENDMGDVLKNAMMSMFGGLGGLGGLNKKEVDSDGDIDDDDESDNDPDVQAIEKLIANIADDNNLD